MLVRRRLCYSSKYNLCTIYYSGHRRYVSEFMLYTMYPAPKSTIILQQMNVIYSTVRTGHSDDCPNTLMWEKFEFNNTKTYNNNTSKHVIYIICWLFAANNIYNIESISGDIITTLIANEFRGGNLVLSS